MTLIDSRKDKQQRQWDRERQMEGKRERKRRNRERENMIDTVSEQKFLMDSYGWSWRLIHHWAHARAAQQEKAYWRTTCQASPQRPTATRSQRREHAPEEAVWSQRETESVTVQANETSLLYCRKQGYTFETSGWLIHLVFVNRKESDLCNIFAI